LILVDNLEISPEYINEARNNNGDTCANIGFAYHVGKKKKKKKKKNNLCFYFFFFFFCLFFFKKKKKKKKKTILKPWHGTN
jgi:hypothetical protein